jgi:energy-coupling factor transporter ATP-binding protein EcfA2
VIIRALRVAELGPFRTGVALEGLTGGFDVLVGPNELGKSSLFNALSMLVEERHTATGERIERLRNAGHGAPVIEADIEINGRSIRIRKRYLEQRQALLQDLTTGSILRGADAEARLAELMSPPALGNAHRRLLWVAQGKGFDPTPPSGSDKDAEKVRGSLFTLIEREAMATTGAGQLRRIAAAVAAEHGALQSGHRPPRPLGEFRNRKENYDKAIAALEAARQKAAESAARREQVTSTRLELSRLTDPEVISAQRSALENAERALTDARKAGEHLRAAGAKSAAAQKAEQAAAIMLAEFETRRNELAALCTALDTASAQRTDLAARLDEAETGHSALQSRQELLSTDIERAQIERRRQSAAGARRELAKLIARVADVDASEHAIAELAAADAANRVTDNGVASARKLDAEITRLEAEARAAAARIEINYEPGARNRILLADRPIANREVVLVQEIVELIVPGIGRIRVLPGRAGSDDTSAAITMHRSELAKLLASMGVTDLAEATAVLATAGQRAQKLAATRARLAALAPDGRKAIEAELARQRQIAACEPDVGDDETLPALPDIDQCAASLEKQRAALDRELAAAAAAVTSATQALAACDAAIAEKACRHAELVARFEIDGHARHDELIAAASAARDALSEARLAQEEWAARTPDPIAFARIESEIERARKTWAEREARVVELRHAIAALEGELRRDDADGVGAELARLEEYATEATARLAAIQTEVAALTLLSGKLQTAQANHRSTTLEPLNQRLRPLLEAIAPGSTTNLDGLTEVGALVRNGRSERFAQLSDGTREQVAVLVRVAWAELLADQSQPVPVVLDDPLVFSDDDRLTHMFAVLARAAKRHQVLVMSCHAKATLAAAEAAGAAFHKLGLWQEDARRAIAASA